MDIIVEQNHITAETPTNRCANCVFMDLNIIHDHSLANSRLYTIRNVLNISKATVELGPESRKVEFGIGQGLLQLELAGCHSIPDPYIKFDDSFISYSSGSNIEQEQEIDDILNGIPSTPQSKTITGLLQKVGIPGHKRKQPVDLYEVNEEVEENEMPHSDLSAKGTPQSPTWEFRALERSIGCYIDQTYNNDKFAHLQLTDDIAVIKASFKVPLKALYIIHSDFIPADISPEKHALIKAVLRKHIWSKYFNPCISTQLLTIKK